MRAFFALAIDSEVRYAIGKWRSEVFPPIGREVALENLHITLCFLGEVSRPQLDRIMAGAQRLHVDACTLKLDRLHYLARSGILWMGATHTPVALTHLVNGLRTVVKPIGVKIDKKAFRPHVTLFRRCAVKPAPPRRQPLFELECGSFSLFESVFTQNRVRYERLAEWPFLADAHTNRRGDQQK